MFSPCDHRSHRLSKFSSPTWLRGSEEPWRNHKKASPFLPKGWIVGHRLEFSRFHSHRHALEANPSFAASSFAGSQIEQCRLPEVIHLGLFRNKVKTKSFWIEKELKPKGVGLSKSAGKMYVTCLPDSAGLRRFIEQGTVVPASPTTIGGKKKEVL